MQKFLTRSLDVSLIKLILTMKNSRLPLRFIRQSLIFGSELYFTFLLNWSLNFTVGYEIYVHGFFPWQGHKCFPVRDQTSDANWLPRPDLHDGRGDVYCL
jgi:hypothetical protein